MGVLSHRSRACHPCQTTTNEGQPHSKGKHLYSKKLGYVHALLPAPDPQTRETQHMLKSILWLSGNPASSLTAFAMPVQWRWGTAGLNPSAASLHPLEFNSAMCVHWSAPQQNPTFPAPMAVFNMNASNLVPLERP